MSITVKDLLELDSLKSFRLIAGASGLNKPIESVGIVDWEFVQGIADESIKFEKSSLVISSLLFAKEDQSLIYTAIEYLMGSGVSAMAYKDIFIKDLPETVIKLANEKNFPIFIFNTAFFEDILVEVHNSIIAADQLRVKSEALQLLISSDLSRNEVQKNARIISRNFKKNIFVTYLYSGEGYHDVEIIRISENSSNIKKDTYEIAVCNYQNGIMFIVSANHNDWKKYKEVVNDIFSSMIIYKEKTTLVLSNVHEIDELDYAIREAYNACVAAKLENKDSLIMKTLAFINL